MAQNDIDITITRETGSVSKAGFGVPLIIGTSAANAYETFTDLASVGEVWGTSTEAYKIANAIFSQSPAPNKIAMVGINYTSGTDPVTDLTDELNTLLNNGNDEFYFITCEEQGTSEITELSSWAGANGRLYFVSTSDNAVLTGLESDRTVVLVHSNAATEYPAEAWIGRCAPEDPGSITWKFKQLSGITIPGFTSSEIESMHSNGGNTYVRKLGYNQTSEGQATDGTYIDIVRSEDFIKARLEENLGQLLYTSPKVPYDNRGIGQVVATIEGVLKRAVGQGIIATDDDGNGIYTVTAPDRNEISTVDIGNRLLPDVEFTFVLAGAIHEIEITGVIQL